MSTTTTTTSARQAKGNNSNITNNTNARSGKRNRRNNKQRNANTGGIPQTPKDEGDGKEGIVADDQDVNKDDGSVPDIDVCFICAEPVKYYSVSVCNHRTCHVCALRLRALYKKTECTFCKHSQESMVFTESPDKPFEEFDISAMTFKDPKLSIYFETQEMMEESLLLLRFNCPVSDCPHIGTGWGDLRIHIRMAHGKTMCDLCTRFKKVFAHEHILYTQGQLAQHLPSLALRSARGQPKEPPEGGVHPLCEFCRECFFGDDEHFAHMRERHEECFVCKRGGIPYQYFRNYDHLEQHFNNAHHPCAQPACREQKFVVFGSLMDLQAHMVEQHGAAMTSKDRKDARRVTVEMEFNDGGGGRDGGRRRRERDREREPPPAANAGSRRREGFGTSLTNEEMAGSRSGTPAQPQQNRRLSPSPLRDGVDAERYALFQERLSQLIPNSTASVTAIRAAIRSYRLSESGPRDLISTVFQVLEQDLDATASLVVALVDALDEEKRRDLLSSWNGFKIEQRREFPDLVPTGVGSQWAGVASGRLLNIKHSSASRSSQQSNRQVWDRVARAAGSSTAPSNAPGPSTRQPTEAFPSLAHPASSQAGGFRQPQHMTPWSSSANTTRAQPPVVRQTSSSSQSKQAKPPSLSTSSFPSLPTVQRNKPAVSGNQSLRNILGNPGPSTSAWVSGQPTNNSSQDDAAAAPSVEPVPSGKKKKGKEKQLLFTLGGFPA